MEHRAGIVLVEDAASFAIARLGIAQRKDVERALYRAFLGVNDAW